LPIDELVQDFRNDIMPYAEKHYRVYTDQQRRAIAGLSMGGAKTLNIAVCLPERFAYVSVFSSGIVAIAGGGSGADGPPWEEQHKDVLDGSELKEGLKLVWFATGRGDFLVETSRATVAMLKKHSLYVVYKETAGAHTWIVWREYLHEFAPQLFQ